jgi:hypothetical protein
VWETIGIVVIDHRLRSVVIEGSDQIEEITGEVNLELWCVKKTHYAD